MPLWDMDGFQEKARGSLKCSSSVFELCRPDERFKILIINRVKGKIFSPRIIIIENDKELKYLHPEISTNGHKLLP